MDIEQLSGYSQIKDLDRERYGCWIFFETYPLGNDLLVIFLTGQGDLPTKLVHNQDLIIAVHAPIEKNRMNRPSDWRGTVRNSEDARDTHAAPAGCFSMSFPAGTTAIRGLPRYRRNNDQGPAQRAYQLEIKKLGHKSVLVRLAKRAGIMSIAPDRNHYRSWLPVLT